MERIDRTKALAKAEQSFNAAEESIENLKKSVRDPNDAVFQKALQNLVSSLDQTCQALSNIEEKDTLSPNLIKILHRTVLHVDALNNDPHIRNKVNAEKNAVLWGQLISHSQIIKSKDDKLSSLKRGVRAAEVENDTQG